MPIIPEIRQCPKSFCLLDRAQSLWWNLRAHGGCTCKLSSSSPTVSRIDLRHLERFDLC